MKISISPSEFSEILLSHHPNKSCFDDDVIVLFNRRICAGCLFGYPTALVIWLFLRPEGVESIFIALFLTLFSQLRRIVNNRIIKMIFRFIAGIGLGFGIGALIWIINTKSWSLLILLLIGVGIYSIFKIRSLIIENNAP